MATKELQAIVRARQEALGQGRSAALVTVFKTTGSTYRRPGARMLVLSPLSAQAADLAGADGLGSISGGCLEDDARERALETLGIGEAVSLVYDTTAEADILLGSGLGCQGVVHALIQPLPPTEGDTHNDPLACVARSLRMRRAGVLASVCAAEARAGKEMMGAFLWAEAGQEATAGNLSTRDPALADLVAADARKVLGTGRSVLRSYPRADGGHAEVFLDAVQPPRSLLICGAGQDAIPLARLGREIGWRVRVVDGRRAYATRERFPDVDELTVCPPREFATRGSVEAGEAVVLMTHNYLHDQEFLRVVLASSAGYIGVLGPRRRTERLLSELAGLPGAALGKRSRQRVHGPAGLDIGAEAPEQIALSIVAEIEAVGARRRGGVLKRRRAPLHEPPRAVGTGKRRLRAVV